MAPDNAHAFEQPSFDFKRDQRAQQRKRICDVALANPQITLKDLGRRFSASPETAKCALRLGGVVRGKDGWGRG